VTVYFLKKGSEKGEFKGDRKFCVNLLEDSRGEAKLGGQGSQGVGKGELKRENCSKLKKKSRRGKVERGK